MAKKDLPKGEVVIYKTSKNEVGLRVRFKNESVWMRQNEIALLFSKDRSVVTKHINKIFADKEADKKSNAQKMHIANSDKPVEFYSIDVILAVGYRTNSARAIRFRKWATKILKRYLIKGYATNDTRLLEAKNKFRELQGAVLFLQKQSKKKLLRGQGTEILNLLADYSKTLSILEQYDKGILAGGRGKKTKFVLDYKDCVNVVEELKKELITKKEAGNLFGQKKDGGFEGIIKGLYIRHSAKKNYTQLLKTGHRICCIL